MKNIALKLPPSDFKEFFGLSIDKQNAEFG